MLIEFRVENHRSIREEQALTFVVARGGDSCDPRPRQIDGLDESLLPAIVLYGANASGKSNVLSGIEFMRDAVLSSFRLWDRDTNIPRSPFAWGIERGKPSLFEATFLIDKVKFEYGFVVNDEVVLEEWLYAWPNGKKQIWLDRELDDFTFGSHLKGENQLIKEVTRSNSLFLSAASQHRHPQLQSIYNWFRNIASTGLTLRRNSNRSSRFMPHHLFQPRQLSLFDIEDSSELVRDRLKKLFFAADIGVVDVKLREMKDDSAKAGSGLFRVSLQHQANDEESWIDLEEESQGTKTLFHMATPIFATLASGGLLVVDELESSLHPLLGQAIAQMFNCPKTNALNAQILFTTHDTNLIGTTLGEPVLRRDQIWLTEKDKSGATKLYPLTSFHPRKAENLERGYLQGRYGAIPFLGDISMLSE
ncbi:MAG: ATP-binding protein [Pirellula sp.]|nr:ATP-binding protein [Pirellula sp.]